MLLPAFRWSQSFVLTFYQHIGSLLDLAREEFFYRENCAIFRVIKIQCPSLISNYLRIEFNIDRLSDLSVKR